MYNLTATVKSTVKVNRLPVCMRADTLFRTFCTPPTCVGCAKCHEPRAHRATRTPDVSTGRHTHGGRLPLNRPHVALATASCDAHPNFAPVEVQPLPPVRPARRFTAGASSRRKFRCAVSKGFEKSSLSCARLLLAQSTPLFGWYTLRPKPPFKQHATVQAAAGAAVAVRPARDARVHHETCHVDADRCNIRGNLFF